MALPRGPLRLLATMALAGFVFAACSNDSAETTAETATTTTATVTTEPTTTTTEPTPAESVFTSYEFPSGLVDGRPTQLQGLLGVPEGEGPFPLAIVMHGSHPPCVDDFIVEAFSDAIVTETAEYLCGENFPEYIRHDIGLGHLVGALSEAGVAAVSIDVESAYVWWGGEPDELGTLESIMATHLDAIAQLNSGDSIGLGIDSLAGRIDLDRISVIGHSRSGGHVASMIDASRDLTIQPVAAVMIEPALAAPVTDYLDVPLLLIRGECDEDVGPDAGRQFLLDTVPSDRTQRVIDLFVPAAGHRSLNTGLNGSTCPDEGDRTAIQDQVAHAVASFITTNSEEIIAVDGVGATVDALIGLPPTIITSGDSVGFDPAAVPSTSSTTELLAPLAEDADFSDALVEDF